jgi:dCTP deaminase
LRRGSPVVAVSEIERLHAAGQLVSTSETEKNLRDGKLLRITVDLRGADTSRLIGYRARKFTDRIDVEKVAHYDWQDFWDPLHYPKDSPLILDPHEFYILVTRQSVKSPPTTPPKWWHTKLAFITLASSTPVSGGVMQPARPF